jgi:lysophospholipase L1-like esterase
MLGTNDVRSDLNRRPQQIAQGDRKPVDVVRGSARSVLTSYPALRVLVVVPPHVEDTSRTPIAAVMAGAQVKSRAPAEAGCAALAGSDAPVFDAATAVRVHGVEGVHMTADDNHALGEAVAVEVARVLARAGDRRRDGRSRSSVLILH